MRLMSFDLFEKRLYESAWFGRTLLCVDIQPGHSNYISFNLREFMRFLSDAINGDEYHSVIYMFNGEDLGYESENQLIDWMIENGLPEDDIDSIRFIEKSYGWFRLCIDSGMEDELLNLLSIMDRDGVHSSDDLDIDELRDAGEITDELYELLKDDSVYMGEPHVFLADNRFGSIDLVGGASEECLKEIEVTLDYLELDYKRIGQWIY